MTQPTQGQDLQEGVYRTPLNLLEPINKRWSLCFDLAANAHNQVVGRLGGPDEMYFAEDANSLEQNWALVTEKMGAGYSWCNPPYDDIGKWTTKAEAEAKNGARIVMLLPSATGATWLTDHCLNAQIVFLIGRPVFEFINSMDHKNPAKRGKPNTDPYGKDMLLVIFDGMRGGVNWWDWRKA